MNENDTKFLDRIDRDLKRISDARKEFGKIKTRRRWLYRLESLGFILAAFAWLIILVELAGHWRFGSFDPWVYRILVPGTPEQAAALIYLALVMILLSCRRT